MTDQEPTRRDRRDLRDRVLRVVEYQTGGAQPVGTTARVVRQVLSSCSDEGPEAVSKALRAAVESGHLLDWTTPAGTWHYTRCTEADLEALARWAGDRGARELVGRAYRARAEVTR
jgi:hypothetical protein